jgi:putative ABC transport system permease protein
MNDNEKKSPDWRREIRRRFPSHPIDPARRNEIIEELAQHLDSVYDEALTRGDSNEEAFRRASMQIDDWRLFECEFLRVERAAVGWPMRASNAHSEKRKRRGWFMTSLLHDFRYSLRTLWKQPVFTMIAVLTLAIGIGANTAVFSVVNAVLLKPLTFRDPDRLVTLTYRYNRKLEIGDLSSQVSAPDLEDLRAQNSTFEAMAFYSSRSTSVMAGPEAEYRQVAGVSADFFRVLGVEPVVGRFYSAEEIQPNSNGAAIISHGFWQSRFGGDRNVIGKTIRLYNKSVTIVGAAPPGFGFPKETEVWVPVGAGTTQYRTANNYLAVGRLKPGVTLDQAQGEITTISARLEEQYPQSNAGKSVAVTRMRDEMVRDVRFTLWLLMGAVALVLLIACANVATLLLARATARTREIAVRVALGAGRGRIVRQLFAESLTLGLFAGVIGALLAFWGVKALIAIAPESTPRLVETSVDGGALIFTVAISFFASLLFGLAPALQASQTDPNEALKQGAVRTGGRGSRARSALVVAELALSVLLLVGAGLLLRSFLALHNTALGFRPESVLVMQATVPNRGPAFANANHFFKDLLVQVRSTPGVLAAGAAMAPPAWVESSTGYWIDHKPKELSIGASETIVNVVTPGVFSTLGVPIKSGRDIDDRDTREAPFTIIINEALARTAFPGQDPLGRVMYVGFDDMSPMTIVGVVGDVRQRGPAKAPAPEVFLPYEQHSYNGATLQVMARTAVDPTTLVETIRRKSRELSVEVPIEFTTLETMVYANTAAPRFRAILIGVFAGLAVCLAMAGVYSVMAYLVSQRSNEIGLRMALGASSSDILRIVIGQGMALAGVGLAIGLLGAIGLTRFLTTLLFGVSPVDPLTYAGVVILLGMSALAACLLPALRATKVDPITALRHD